MNRAEDGLVHDWDRGDRAEWSAPELPAVRWSRMVVAFVMIVAAALVGIFGSVPGTANGATLLGVLLIVGAIRIVLAEVRRG